MPVKLAGMTPMIVTGSLSRAAVVPITAVSPPNTRRQSGSDNTATAPDAERVARVQLRTWRTAYADVVPPGALDLPEEQVAATWLAAVERPPGPRHRVLVALDRAGSLPRGTVGRLLTVDSTAGSLRVLRADVVSQGQNVAQVAVFDPLGPGRDPAQQAFVRIALASGVGPVLGEACYSSPCGAHCVRCSSWLRRRGRWTSVT